MVVNRRNIIIIAPDRCSCTSIVNPLQNLTRIFYVMIALMVALFLFPLTSEAKNDKTGGGGKNKASEKASPKAAEKAPEQAAPAPEPTPVPEPTPEPTPAPEPEPTPTTDTGSDGTSPTTTTTDTSSETTPTALTTEITSVLSATTSDALSVPVVDAFSTTIDDANTNAITTSVTSDGLINFEHYQAMRMLEELRSLTAPSRSRPAGLSGFKKAKNRARSLLEEDEEELERKDSASRSLAALTSTGSTGAVPNTAVSSSISPPFVSSVFVSMEAASQ